MILLSRMASRSLIPALALLVCGFGVESGKRPSMALIVTAAPVYQPLAALRGGDRFPKGAELMLVQDGVATQLVQGFAATADANVSFDGKKMLFAGKERASDTWSVWEFTIDDRSVRKVVGGESDVVRPLYLPGDGLVFARYTTHGFQLETANLDGSGSLPLSYMAASALPETVLADGRIMFQAGFPLGTDLDHGAVPELLLVYSDGSGVESYRCDHGTPRWGGTQLASGDIVFTHGSLLARFTSPLARETSFAAPRADYAGSVAETESGSWLLSSRPNPGAHFALKRWKPGSQILENVLARDGLDVVQPVELAPRSRPNRHPTALHKWDYANVLALDARQSRDGAMNTAPLTVRVEGLEANGKTTTLGTAPVEPDGSFFVKIPGDTPIRFALLDDNGAELRKEHGWFWMRKGEQRYCVGCHAGPEHAPDNRVPAVLLRTTTPADLTGLGQSSAPGGR